MVTLKLFWVLIAFYVVAKICFFTGVYLVTKAVERRAIREKRKRLENYRMFELETVMQDQHRDSRNRTKDRELFGLLRKRYVA
ncbi:MAG: hypothetical protein HPY50_00860 [Firmicutes bacterium]|nr:hypothetical protein [Bacillota bacterium]